MLLFSILFYFAILLQVVDDKKEEQARQTLDANDAEMDRGQTKKTKTNVTMGRVNPGYNPFNEQQINRNAWTLSNGSIAASTNGTANKPRPFEKYQVYRQKPNHNRPFNAANRFNNKRPFGNNKNNKTFNRRQ